VQTGQLQGELGLGAAKGTYNFLIIEPTKMSHLEDAAAALSNT
jgi:hypothetical protein